MKKLTKKNLDELALIMPIISEDKQRDFVGGTDVHSIKINGGTLICYDYGSGLGQLTVYQPDDGSASIVFDGVICYDSSAPDGSAYQLNGGIRVGEDPHVNFDIGTLIHEYGHFLQQVDLTIAGFNYFGPQGAALGYLSYFIGVGGGSLYGRLNPDTDYYEIFTEKDASERGQAYIDKYYPHCGYKANGL